jgi:hypothetical protein
MEGVNAVLPEAGPALPESGYGGQQNSPDSAHAIPPASSGAGPAGTPVDHKCVVAPRLAHWVGTSDGRYNRVASERQPW